MVFGEFGTIFKQSFHIRARLRPIELSFGPAFPGIAPDEEFAGFGNDLVIVAVPWVALLADQNSLIGTGFREEHLVSRQVFRGEPHEGAFREHGAGGGLEAKRLQYGFLIHGRRMKRTSRI